MKERKPRVPKTNSSLRKSNLSTSPAPDKDASQLKVKKSVKLVPRVAELQPSQKIKAAKNISDSFAG